jgi:hypothetical protein
VMDALLRACVRPAVAIVVALMLRTALMHCYEMVSLDMCRTSQTRCETVGRRMLPKITPCIRIAARLCAVDGRWPTELNPLPCIVAITESHCLPRKQALLRLLARCALPSCRHIASG